MRNVAALAALAVTACYGGATVIEQGGATDGSSSAGSTTVAGSGTASTTGGSGASTTGSDDSAAGSTGDDSDTGGEDEPRTDPLDGFPTGQDQWELLCARGHADAIASAICAGDAPPSITSITELLDLVGLGFQPGVIGNAENGNPGFTFSYHSTAISTRFVNPLNPRSFVFTPPVGGVVFPPSGIPDPNLVMMGFTRGEPFVELVANDPVDDELRFYLFRFVPGCEQDPEGCNNADLLTPAVESGFVGWSLYDDGDISNTILDCLQCHQPDGPGTTKMLRMQELEEGWTHWFYPNRPENRLAMETFVDAHEGESYGGIPAELLTRQLLLENGEGSARPVGFNLVVRNEGFAPQPNEFSSVQIRMERNSANCQCFNCPNEPVLDPTNSCSPTWDALYANSVQGTEIAAPYFDGRIDDPIKVASASLAYADTMAGNMPGDQMPDIRDVLRDEALPYLSFEPAPGLTGRQILSHMCQHCHNSSLDQTISRSHFNVETLDALPQYVRDEAIRRLTLADDDVERMPPQRFHSLSQAQIDLVVAELEP